VAKVGLGVQRISGGPEFTDWESKIDAGSSPGPRFWHQNDRKTLHIAHEEAHERYLMSKSLISRRAG
jgi:hypothetical protein